MTSTGYRVAESQVLATALAELLFKARESARIG